MYLFFTCISLSKLGQVPFSCIKDQFLDLSCNGLNVSREKDNVFCAVFCLSDTVTSGSGREVDVEAATEISGIEHIAHGLQP